MARRGLRSLRISVRLAGRHLGLEGGEALSELLLFCPSLADVPHDGRHAQNVACRVAKKCHAELYRYPCRVLADGWNGEQFPAVPCDPGRHRFSEAGPVPLTQPLRDDEVQALAQCLLRRIAEDSLSSSVPEANDTVAIGQDDRVRGTLHDPLA